MSEQPQPQPQRYPRFTAAQRFEHVVIIVCFLLLALTGLPQKYATADWARLLIDLLGGIESTRVLHRLAAMLLMAEVLYHVGALVYKLWVLGRKASLLLGYRDFRDAANWVLYNLGMRSAPPDLPRYNFGQKAEYLAFAWAIVTLIITGLMMWNPIATTQSLPGGIIPAARSVHGAAAIFALLLAFTWHLYNTLLRGNFSIFSGRLSRRRMAEDHAEELAALDEGQASPANPSAVIAQRRRLFWPLALVVGVIVVAGLVSFLNYGEATLTTVPRQEVRVYAPPTDLQDDGDAQVGAALWHTLRCAFCHGEEATGLPDNGPALAGTDLSRDAFFLQVREGSQNMPTFGTQEIPDGYLLDLWTWLSTATTP